MPDMAFHSKQVTDSMAIPPSPNPSIGCQVRVKPDSLADAVAARETRATKEWENKVFMTIVVQGFGGSAGTEGGLRQRLAACRIALVGGRPPGKRCLHSTRQRVAARWMFPGDGPWLRSPAGSDEE